jgi:hypothetical protein
VARRELLRLGRNEGKQAGSDIRFGKTAAGFAPVQEAGFSDVRFSE